MRLLAGLGLLSPFAIAALVAASQTSARPSLTDAERNAAVPSLAVVAGVTSTALVAWLYFRLWFGRIVKAAEKIAAGELEVRISGRGRGLSGRLAEAINGIASSMAE